MTIPRCLPNEIGNPATYIVSHLAEHQEVRVLDSYFRFLRTYRSFVIYGTQHKRMPHIQSISDTIWLDIDKR